MSSISYFHFFLVVLGFELRALDLLGKHSILVLFARGWTLTAVLLPLLPN
jgi:hypothetical protein